MGTFAETAHVVYCLSFANQGKLILVFHFRLQRKKNRMFAFSVCRKQMEVAVFRKFRFPFAEFRKHGYMEMETKKHGDMKTWRHKNMATWKHGDIEQGDIKTFICCLSVCRRRTDRCHPVSNGLNRIGHLCLRVLVTYVFFFFRFYKIFMIMMKNKRDGRKITKWGGGQGLSLPLRYYGTGMLDFFLVCWILLWLYCMLP